VVLSLRNAVVFLVAVCAGIIAGGSALAVDSVLVAVTRVAPGTYGPSGLQAATTIRATTMTAAANNSLFYDRAVTFSKANLAGAARTRLAAGVASAAALSAVIIGAGYAIDYLTGQVTNTPSSAANYCGTFLRRGGTGLTGAPAPHVNVLVCGPSPQAITNLLKDTWLDGSYAYGEPFTYTQSGANYTVGLSIYHYSNWSVVHHTDYKTVSPPVSPPAPGTYTPAPQTATAVADSTLSDVIATSPAALTEALTLTNGNPNAAIVPLPATMAEVQATHRALTNNPLPVGTPEPVAATAANAATAPSAWPEFCTYAAPVCALVDYVMDDSTDETSPPEVEWLDPPTASTWTSGLASDGTCPAPIQLTIPGLEAEVEFPYQPLCDLAVYLRALILAAAALTAAFIIGGRRNA